MTEEEFGGLFADHYGAVLGYGLRRVDAATAHDVAAEVFVVAWRRLGAVPEHPRSWLLAVARRVLANELRRRQRLDRLHQRLAETHGDVPPVVVGEPADERLAQALARLRPSDQEVLRLVGWEELDAGEAAEVLGCSRAAFRVRLHRARRRLEEQLRELGPEATGPGRPLVDPVLTPQQTAPAQQRSPR
ncbi:RNA polymerase sigma factor [Quadrisphaera setariae]|uniref:RNA polymerase sigma factor n=1 Tax=Quadrisphaera setariae TaxID=2593304 RepID=A0A5C8ZEB4_9ACTN|nr:RNA polymerase sigma factor [Quadrisphaera setariae]TXR55543.1 RNA polymerase sigma factor [Quadrisphaera setariae]